MGVFCRNTVDITRKPCLPARCLVVAFSEIADPMRDAVEELLPWESNHVAEQAWHAGCIGFLPGIEPRGGAPTSGGRKWNRSFVFALPLAFAPTREIGRAHG